MEFLGGNMRIRLVRAVVIAGVAALLGGAAVALATGQLATASPPLIPPRAVPDAVARAVAHPTTNPTLQFVAVAPCRIVDTRSKGGVLGPAKTRTFQVTGATGFTAQGGKTTGCGIPAGAQSVALTATALTPQGAGGLTFYPVGSARPLSRALTINNGVSVSGSSDLVIGTGGKIDVYNAASGSTQLLLDVNGYYTQQLAALIYTGSGAYAYSGTNHVVSVAHISTGTADVTLDRDVSLCTVTTTGFYETVNSAAQTSSVTTKTIRIYTWQLDSTSHLETPIDTFVAMTVTC
jgi:hypothetical protein